MCTRLRFETRVPTTGPQYSTSGFPPFQLASSVRRAPIAAPERVGGIVGCAHYSTTRIAIVTGLGSGGEDKRLARVDRRKRNGASRPISLRFLKLSQPLRAGLRCAAPTAL